jgi:hypothetical protein
MHIKLKTFKFFSSQFVIAWSFNLQCAISAYHYYRCEFESRSSSLSITCEGSVVSFNCTYSIEKTFNDTVHWVNSWTRAKPIDNDRDNLEQCNCQVISTSFCVILFYIFPPNMKKQRFSSLRYR